MHHKSLQIYIGWLEDMITKIEIFTKDTPTREEFEQDDKTLHSVISPLTQIGEICGKISKLYPESLQLPYREIVGMRTILVHMYHKIEAKSIWDTIIIKIPELKKLIQEYKDNTSL